MKRNLSFLLFVLSIHAAIAQVPTNGLVGWYPFNRTPNDATGFGNNGVATNVTLTADRCGVANAAYDFNGTTSRILVPSVNDSLKFNNLQDNYSVVVWVKSSDPNIGASSCRILEHRSASGTGYPFSFIANNANNVLTCQGYDGVNVSTTAVGSQLFDGNWHMVTYVVNNTLDSLYGYVDNSLFVSGPNNLSQTSTLSDTLTFGNAISGNRPYSGAMDDIRIYNRALSASEVSALYNENLCTQYITVTDTLIINANLTGFNPIAYQNTILVYPNPTNDHITIDYGNFATMAGYTLKISNSLGQTVFTSPISQQQSYVDLSTWGGFGIYFVHLIDAQSHTIDIRKIVLQ